MIGWLPKSDDPRIASVRYRCLYPVAELRKRGLPVEIFSRRRLKKYAAVIFSKLYDDPSYELAKELKGRGSRIVFDICDNHFYDPQGRAALKRVRLHLLRMLALSDLVVASTEPLAQVLSHEGQLTLPPVVIGDPVEDLTRAGPDRGRSWLRRRSGLEQLRGQAPEGLVRILWYGVHGGDQAPFGMLDILRQQDLLAAVHRTHPFELIVVSNSRHKFETHIRPLPFPTRYLEWRKVDLGRVMSGCRLNIIPITKNPFTLCKSNNRLALALYAGLPTVADEIPSYRELSPHCVLNDWERGVELYLRDGEVARRHLEGARRYLEEHFSIRRIGDLWAHHLSNFL
jgi:hypothetical protein